MAREIDPKSKRKAMRQLARLKAAANDQDGAAAAVAYSEWETEFIEGVSERIDKFGSAFSDFGKGAPDAALSRLQEQKLKELAKKARQQARVRAPTPAPDHEQGGGEDGESERPAPKGAFRRSSFAPRKARADRPQKS